MANLSSLTVNDTGNLTLPTGTTANRPSLATTNIVQWTNTGTQAASVIAGSGGTYSSTSWTCPTGVNFIEVLVVAGGGAGANNNSGGGGAGGLIYNNAYPVTPGTAYTVTVGAGGTGQLTAIGDGPRQTYQNGSNSVFGGLTALGGGGASGWNQAQRGFDGGSGGGSGGNPTSATSVRMEGGSGTTGQGYNGGAGSLVPTGDSGGGGGGGAGGPGQNALWGGSTGRGGDGGPGLAFSINGTFKYYAAGGGGGGGGGGQGGNGGVGQTFPEGHGGSNSAPYLAGQNAAASTGNGGGGGDNSNGGNGGSGVVVIRYTITNPTGQTRFNTVPGTLETATPSNSWLAQQNSFGDKIPTNGLAVYLDGAKYVSGTTWYDLSGNGNNGTLTNGPTYTSTNGGAIVTDGVDDYITYPLTCTTAMTVITVAKSNHTDANAWGTNQYAGMGSCRKANGYIIHNNPSDRSVNFYVLGSDGTTTTGFGAVYPTNIQTPNFYAMTTNGIDNHKAYLNGSLVINNSTSVTRTGTNTTTGILGWDDGIASRYNKLNIHCHIVYNRQLTDAEIFQVYQSLRTRFALPNFTDKPGYVTRGLMLNLDANDYASYPETGATWYDTAGGNHVSLGGSSYRFNRTVPNSIDFAGATTGSVNAIVTGYPFTVNVIAQHANSWVPSASGMQELVNFNISSQRISIGIVNNSGWTNGPTIMYGGSNHWSCSTSGWGTTSFVMVTYVIYGNNDDTHRIYVNGIEQAMVNNGGSHGGTAGWSIGSNSTSAEYWPNQIGVVQVYNRALDKQEVRQNYLAFKNRYGLS